ncbi:MAG: hypothetical protein SOZ18_03265 [Phocaeicola sp.]|nr:hypothetical protein [Phocaeicola sp.]
MIASLAMNTPLTEAVRGVNEGIGNESLGETVLLKCEGLTV